MGASRTDPTRNSLGEILQLRYKINPNWLSYVIPLLKEDGFCDIVQDGRAFTVIYKGQKRTKQPSDNQNNKQDKPWVHQLLYRIDMVEKLTKEDQGIFLPKNLIEEYRAIVKKAISFSADPELKQLDSHPEPLGILDSQKDWLLNEIRRLRAILEHPI